MEKKQTVGASYAPTIMPEYRRIRLKGGTYFFTVVTFGRRPFLTKDQVRSALREGIQAVRKTLPFTIGAWVLLPDHLHTIWTLPENDDNFASRWAIIKRGPSKRGGFLEEDQGKNSDSHSKRGERRIWQRRFWDHLIRDEHDFQRHLDYLHWNPVKHGHVKRVLDWPYSTLHRFVNQGVYPADWGGVNEDEINKVNFGE